MKLPLLSGREVLSALERLDLTTHTKSKVKDASFV
jgi:hypothetical protein